MSLVTLPDAEIGAPVALAGAGPHSPPAARRAADFSAVDGTVPTLLNVQRSASGDATDPVADGKNVIADVAARAGLEQDDYETEVVVADDVEAALIDSVARYDTICVGLSERSDVSRIRFGTIAERISQDATSNVAIIRGTNDSP